MKAAVNVDCGWGRLIFGQTYEDPAHLASTLTSEQEGRRDVALYVRDPHVVVSFAPQDLFLDPSLTYRLDFDRYKTGDKKPVGVVIRPLKQGDDAQTLDRLYLSRSMVPAYEGFYDTAAEVGALKILIAADGETGEIIGAVTGVDHYKAFSDIDNGCSLWALVVDPQCQRPAVGEALVRSLIEYYASQGRRFLDLSVMHDNSQAIGLYQKLGFQQVPVYCIKNKNSINEQLFIGPEPEEDLNIYAKIIVDEARRRGISVDVLDAQNGYFKLSLGGRSIACRESLSELTTAIAMSRCDDKAVTRRLLSQSGLRVPQQVTADDPDRVASFLKRHKRAVVKPAQGEQGRGIKVDLSELADVLEAIEEAKDVCEKVLLEEFVQGHDLRIIVIDNEVVAAAIRKPAQIKGDGKRTIEELIHYYSRRRAAATSGESTIPLDAETQRCIEMEGYKRSDILPEGITLQVRKTANLHTGGTIHDVTDQLNSVLENAAIKAAMTLDIPCVGLDFMVPDVAGEDYAIIEANERAGLANHEPQPTAEKFIDMLFPNTKKVEV
ncbi:N-acetylglutaminylglutamine synthetase [Terasakiella sp. A23]|uniref:N-acetylglutaminylglutamine synthetase n=1 Tax=Terasakiella sp. FCG-A23 TaxID=3080561 RepID=UPI002953224C|nr:N-acetylglutaminylglutamine synthetase [Terasakiella sp. A23]MDV7340929.1 N-acetylglutaminylglutamine synthetase [Terasakiella sp. A23]